MQNWVCTNSQPAAILAFRLFGSQPAGGSIGTSAAAMKNGALPADLAARRQLALVADRDRHGLVSAAVS